MISPSIELLFKAVRDEIAGSASASEVELIVAGRADPVERERGLLLFELAREALINPELEKRFVEEVVTSETRTVQAEVLHEQLRQIQKRIETPLFSLKGGRAVSASQGASQTSNLDELTRPLPPLQRASTIRRMLAFGTDASVVALLAVGVALVAVVEDHSGSERSFFKDLIVGQRTLDIYDLLIALEMFVMASALIFLAYSLLSLKYFKTTLGAHLNRITLCTEYPTKMTGYRFRFSQAFVRVATFPLSCLVFGYVPLMFGRRTLHDVVSATDVLVKP